MSKPTNYSGGASTTGLLGIVFVVLKLTHVIDWSWWWVTCPFWAPAVVLLIIALIAGVIALAVYLTE